MPERASGTPLFMAGMHIVVGNFLTANGAGATDLGFFPRVALTHVQSKARGSNKAGHMMKGATYDRGGRLRIEVTGFKNQVAVIAALVTGITPRGNGFNVSSEMTRVTEKSLALVPVGELAGAIDSADVYWVPAFDSEGDLSWVFDGTREGDDTNETYTVNLVSLYDEAMPAGLREYFRGSPNVTGRALGWSLPPAYAAGP